MALGFVHVLSVSVWTGGVVALLWCVLIAHRDDTAENARALGGTVWRFSVTAMIATALLITARVLQAFDRLVLLQQPFARPFGDAPFLKIVLFLVGPAIWALNVLCLGPPVPAWIPARAAR